MLLALASFALGRTGYSPDEEITSVIARATARVGLPLLPSGIFYNRGLPYTYAASVFGVLFGHSLESYRAASLLIAVLGLVLAFVLARERGSRLHAWLIVLLLATLPAYLSVAVFARYYSTLVTSTLLALWLFARLTAERGSARLFLAAVVLANALHPLGVVLAGLPLVASLSASSDRLLRRLSAQAIAVALGSQVFVYGLHWISLVATRTTPTTDTAVYSFTTPRMPASFYTIETAPLVWWGLGVICFGALAYTLGRRRDLADRWLIGVAATLALFFQLGGLMLLVCLTPLVARARGLRLLVPAGVLFFTAVMWWPFQMVLHTSAGYSLALVSALTRSAVWYPFNSLAQIVAWHPGLAAAAFVGLVLAVMSDDPMSRLVRIVGVIGLSTLAGYDVGGVPVLERYLLVPIVLVVVCAAHGVSHAWALAHRAFARPVAGWLLVPASAAAFIGWVACGYYTYALHRGDDDVEPTPVRWVAPETGTEWTPESFNAIRDSSDVVICTEELACQHLLGRVDYLLATVPDDAAHYVVSRRGEARGFYGNAPAIRSAAELEAVVSHLPPNRCASVVGLYTNKVGFGEYWPLLSALPATVASSQIRNDLGTFVTRLCRR